jgi:hypothetical protein
MADARLPTTTANAPWQGNDTAPPQRITRLAGSDGDDDEEELDKDLDDADDGGGDDEHDTRRRRRRRLPVCDVNQT